MCGIAGIAGPKDFRLAAMSVRAMTDALARRGPDSEGVRAWKDATLGHRRLAIFDLSEAGRQPMLSPDRTVGLVFNGAIYNYRDLRRELETHGFVFRSHTDTEVLLHGYSAWGIDRLVPRLRGMFAFAIWDDRHRRLYLVRDRLGVKPLVYIEKNGCIAFASTVGALQRAGYVSELDNDGILDFLQFGFVTDTHSIFKEVAKVPSGCILEWSHGFLKCRRYWSPPVAEVNRPFDFQEAVEETESLLLDAVQLRLHADVPVGTLLSGGIDSALVCWAVAQFGANLTAFTVGTPGDSWDETEAACETARRLGIQHKVLSMSPAQAPQVEELVSAYAEPFACPSALGMLAVSRSVSTSARVLLTGDGGDDVFLGYPRHRHLWLAGKLSGLMPRQLHTLWRLCSPTFPRKGALRRLAALLDYSTIGWQAYLRNRNQLAFYSDHRVLGNRFNHRTCEKNTHENWERSSQLLSTLVEYEFHTYFTGEYLTKVDGATMHYALEARSPFLDQSIWEFASRLPFDIRLQHGRLKSVLRELARRKVGRAVALRSKQGFGIPVHRWIAGRWFPKVEAAFHESLLSRDGWIDAHSALDQLQVAAQRGVAPPQLWHLFVLESWFRCNRSSERQLAVAPAS